MTMKKQGEIVASEYDDTDIMIAKFFVRKNIPFLAVAAPEFQQLVCKGRPRYKVYFCCSFVYL